MLSITVFAWNIHGVYWRTQSRSFEGQLNYLSFCEFGFPYSIAIDRTGSEIELSTLSEAGSRLKTMASTDLPTRQNPNDNIKRRQTQSAHDILMQMGFPKQRAYVNNVNKNITVHENKSSPWKMDLCWSDTLYNRPTTWVLIHRELSTIHVHCMFQSYTVNGHIKYLWFWRRNVITAKF